MEPVTTEQMFHTCAIQAVRIEILVEKNRNLAAVLEANNQQLVEMASELEKAKSELAEARASATNGG